jgi:hypothetical protein
MAVDNAVKIAPIEAAASPAATQSLRTASAIFPPVPPSDEQTHQKEIAIHRRAQVTSSVEAPLSDLNRGFHGFIVAAVRG